MVFEGANIVFIFLYWNFLKLFDPVHPLFPVLRRWSGKQLKLFREQMPDIQIVLIKKQENPLFQAFVRIYPSRC
jgi:hypothetical protein